MTGSIIIYGGNKKQRQEKVLEVIEKTVEELVDLENLSKEPDVKIIEVEEDKKSIGIEKSREIVNFLQEKPFSMKYKIVVVFDADRMTTQAQNTLLKTLEEPPSYAIILLTTKAENSLIETVLSRCRKVKVERSGNEIDYAEKGIKEVLKMSLGERLEFISELSKEDKEIIVEILEEWIGEERGEMIKIKVIEKAKNKSMNIKYILSVLKDLEDTNINTKLALENLVLNLI